MKERERMEGEGRERRGGRNTPLGYTIPLG